MRMSSLDGVSGLRQVIRMVRKVGPLAARCQAAAFPQRSWGLVKLERT